MRLNSANLSILKRLLIGRNSRPLKSILTKLPAPDIASLFTTLHSDVEKRNLVDALMSIDKAADVLPHVPEPQLLLLLQKLEKNKLMALINFSPEEDAAYFLSLMEHEEREPILEAVDQPRQSRLRQFLNYPEGSAGRMMTTEVFSIPVTLTAQEGLEYLRSRAQQESIYYIYCVDDEKRLSGVVSLRALATAPAGTKLSDLTKRDVITVQPDTPADEVAQIVKRYNFIALPVVDKDNRMIGLITVDDVLDLIQEQATANLYAAAGVQEDDRVYTPATQTIRNRLPWMMLNLLLAALASAVVAVFEDTMSKLIILATTKNIVAGMGGNTAVQTLTVVTRGLATGDFNFISKTKVLLKESFVGLTIGTVTGLAAGVLIYLWDRSALVAVVMFVAMVVNSFAASFSGALVPMVLKRFNWDPAVGSGVIVTTVTDIVGFFSFLGTAALGLKYLNA